MKRICPFCKKEIKQASHVYLCCPHKDIPKKEIKYLYIKENFSEISKQNILYHEYIEKMLSLPDIRNKYSIDYKSTIFLLDYFDIKRRNIQESSKNSRVKAANYLYKKYGVKNVSQLQSIKNKKAKTFLKNYGVDNVFKTKEFKESLNSFYINKYGINRTEFLSLKGKEIWESLNNEEKNLFLSRSIFKGTYSESLLEIRIRQILTNAKIKYTIHFQLGLKSFDIKIKHLLIEINGTFWHADPRKYKETDELPFPGKLVIAKDIWEKDEFKKELAKNNGFVLKTLWEKDLKTLSDKEILMIIKNWMKEAFEK